MRSMSANIVTVVAILKAKPGQEEALRGELLALIPTTRAESGCLNYDLHRALDNPAVFVFHENWKTKADLDAHLAKPHLTAFFAKAGDLLAEPAQVLLCEQVGASADSLKETVRKRAETIVAAGKDVSKQIADLVAQAAEGFHRSGAGLVELTKAVMEGAAGAVGQSLPKEPESVLRQVIDGVGEGLNRAALTTRLALEEARASQKSFAAEDLARVRQDLQALNSLYLETVFNALGQVRAQAVEERDRLRHHAATAWEKVRPALQSALEAARQHPAELGKETFKAGVDVTRQAAGALFAGMGRWLDEAGRKLRG